MGKNPQVAPYSGAILAMVARSTIGNAAAPEPKNSTNFPTTPCFVHNDLLSPDLTTSHQRRLFAHVDCFRECRPTVPNSAKPM
jgi:hypothetical protein